jgi:hypothetical protein
MENLPLFYALLNVIFLAIYSAMNIAMLPRTRKGARWTRIVSAAYGFILCGLYSWLLFVSPEQYFEHEVGPQVIRPAVAIFFGYLAAQVVFSYFSGNKKS